MKCKRFDIIMVNFGNDVIGSEQGGIRPALVIQNNTGNLFSSCTIVMPFTSKINHCNQPTHSLIKKGDGKGLTRDSMLLGECIRHISEQRILKRLGTLTDKQERVQVKMVYDAIVGKWD